MKPDTAIIILTVALGALCLFFSVNYLIVYATGITIGMMGLNLEK